jgi:plasmid stabilization system protein ParE
VHGGLRRVNAGKYAIFYIANETKQLISVIRTAYGGMDLDRLLEETTSDA